MLLHYFCHAKNCIAEVLALTTAGTKWSRNCVKMVCAVDISINQFFNDYDTIEHAGELYDWSSPLLNPLYTDNTDGKLVFTNGVIYFVGGNMTVPDTTCGRGCINLQAQNGGPRPFARDGSVGQGGPGGPVSDQRLMLYSLCRCRVVKPTLAVP